METPRQVSKPAGAFCFRTSPAASFVIIDDEF
jgi:hypothetical protein